MINVPPDMAQAAKDAAAKVEAELLKMLLMNETGEVAAILGHNDLEVEARPKHQVFRRKLQRGPRALISRVG